MKLSFLSWVNSKFSRLCLLSVRNQETADGLVGLQSVSVLVNGKQMNLTKIIRAEGGPKQWSTL